MTKIKTENVRRPLIVLLLSAAPWERGNVGLPIGKLSGNARVITPLKSASLNNKKMCMRKYNSNTSVFVWLLPILFNSFKDYDESEKL